MFVLVQPLVLISDADDGLPGHHGPVTMVVLVDRAAALIRAFFVSSSAKDAFSD
jgi:hypothetical protein